MDDSQKESLEILIYLFLHYNKFDEAFALSLILSEYFPEDPLVNLSLAFAALKSNTPSTALNAIQSAEFLPKSKELDKLFFVLKSKTMWVLGCHAEVGPIYTHFLGIQERDLRLAVACSNPKTKALS
jgi:hypothetical protein